MKCTGKGFAVFSALLASGMLLTGCQSENIVAQYESENYNTNLYEGHLFAEDLCVSSEDVSINDFEGDSSLHAAALFDLDDQTVDYAYQIHEKIYPASTTKILTALVAMQNCSLDEVVTVSADAAASSFAADAQVCGLMEGDQITLEALINGLLLHSGNDTAVAIAEYVSGSTEAFADLMNQEAEALGANNTHFVTPNGLHDDDHYTTAYDMYLIFNECIKHQEFLDIINSASYTADVTGMDGSAREITWYPTSYYARGEAALPEGAEIFGGKTGYTGEAGNCLILLDKDENGKNYISIVMGAETKDLLYQDMSAIINQIPNINQN